MSDDKRYDGIFNPDIFKRLDIDQDEENNKIQEQIEKEKKDNESNKYN